MSTTVKSLALSVQIDNGFDTPVDVADTVISVRTSHGVDLDAAACTVRLSIYPNDVDLRYRVYVYARIDGGTLDDAILFNGEISDIVVYKDNTVDLICTDYLSRLSYEWSDTDRIYESEDSSAVVQNLVEASGIDVSLTDIQAPSGWTVGVASPVVLATGDTPRALIRALDEAEPFWRTWTRPNGAIRRRPLPVVASESSVASLVYATDIIDITWHYSLDGMYNAARVTGATYNDVPIEELYQSGTGGYVPDPPKYFTTTLQSYLIEDPTRAQSVAQTLADNLFNTMYHGSATIPLRHDIEPGDVITIDDCGPFGTCFVATIEHQIPECTTTMEIRLPAFRR